MAFGARAGASMGVAVVKRSRARPGAVLRCAFDALKGGRFTERTPTANDANCGALVLSLWRYISAIEGGPRAP
jgi:hypothetical protein